MVALSFDSSAYHYGEGLKAIELMWIAARQSFAAREMELRNEISEYERYLEAGGEPIGEWEGPNRLWDHEGRLKLEIQAISDAEIELCAATTIAIYHHWERFVPSNSGNSKRQHIDLKNDLKNAGISIHTNIDALQFAANYLKHGSTSWLDRLAQDFGEKFPRLKKRNTKTNETWVRRLSLNTEHIDWFFAIAKESNRPIFPN